MSYLPGRLGYKITENGGNKVHTLAWFIPRFLSITNCKYIRSYETEYVDNIREKQFKIKIKFCGLDNDLIEIYCLYTECVVLNVNVKLFGYNENTNIKTTPNVWEHIMLLDEKKVNFSYLRGHTFFQFTISSNVSEPVELQPGRLTQPTHQLVNDLKFLLNSNMFSDVTLISVEGFEFKVHKVILSSRSTVLKAHFEHDTIENQTNTIKSHLDTEVLREVLTYIYTDEVPRLQEMTERLLEAAEFYDLPGLKDISVEILYLKLTVENALETLQIADLYSAPHLTKLTLEFIKDGNAGLITETDGWKAIKSVNVIKTLCEFVLEYQNN